MYRYALAGFFFFFVFHAYLRLVKLVKPRVLTRADDHKNNSTGNHPEFQYPSTDRKLSAVPLNLAWTKYQTAHYKISEVIIFYFIARTRYLVLRLWRVRT